MAGKIARKRQAIAEAGSGITPTPTSALVAPETGAFAALLDLAEELGRLVARRLLAESGPRRGYGLPEFLLGAAIMALVWVIVARMLGGLLP